NSTSRIFSFVGIGNGPVALVSGLTLTKGKVTDSGGAVFSSQSLILDHVAITGSSATIDGGAVYVFNAPLTVLDSLVSNNTAGGRGGGIGSDSVASIMQITRSTLTQNTAGIFGGAIALDV